VTKELALYESARAALAKAVKVDEVKQIHDKATAMEAAAKVYKDKSLEADAREIRMRAKRRLGELIKEQKKTVGLSAGTRGSKKKGARVDDKPTLAEAGIDKNLAHAARTEAAKSDQQFEQDVVAEKERITAPRPPKKRAAAVQAARDAGPKTSNTRTAKHSQAALNEFKYACGQYLPQLTDKDWDSAMAVIDEHAEKRAEENNRKEYAKEAKDPQKALDDRREQDRHYEMDCDRDDAKREARESGERWSEVKDEWEADWLRDNWDDAREQEFLADFKKDWQRRHGQGFPNSNFAATPNLALPQSAEQSIEERRAANAKLAEEVSA
jgi:hypothetical protein